MKSNRFVRMAVFAFLAFTARNVAAQQAASTTGVPVHMAVTVEARKGEEIPIINREDVMVHEGRDRDPVTEWIPATGERAALELFILLDDGANVHAGDTA